MNQINRIKNANINKQQLQINEFGTCVTSNALSMKNSNTNLKTCRISLFKSSCSLIDSNCFEYRLI